MVPGILLDSNFGARLCMCITGECSSNQGHLGKADNHDAHIIQFIHTHPINTEQIMRQRPYIPHLGGLTIPIDWKEQEVLNFQRPFRLPTVNEGRINDIPPTRHKKTMGTGRVASLRRPRHKHGPPRQQQYNRLVGIQHEDHPT